MPTSTLHIAHFEETKGEKLARDIEYFLHVKPREFVSLTDTQPDRDGYKAAILVYREPKS